MEMEGKNQLIVVINERRRKRINLTFCFKFQSYLLEIHKMKDLRKKFIDLLKYF